MTTSPTTKNSNERELPISPGDLAYVCARNQSQAHSLLIRAVRTSGLSQKELAKRTGIDEATVSRVLSRPRNLEINTLSKLYYGACGAMISFSPVSLSNETKPGIDFSLMELHNTAERNLYWKRRTINTAGKPTSFGSAEGLDPFQPVTSVGSGQSNAVEMEYA